MYRWSELIISREQGLRYDVGFAGACADVMMGHVYAALTVAVLGVQ